MKNILLFFFIWPILIFCQVNPKGSISGLIRTDHNVPLSNASIKLINTNLGAVSDFNGKFILKTVPSGNYVLKVSFLGYQSYQKKINLKEGQAVQLNIHLKDTSVDVDEVRIIANGQRELMAQPNRMSIITTKNISQAPVQNIQEIMDFSPGVNMSNTLGIFSSKTTVTLRGLPANDQSRTLVLLDGVPLNKSDEGSVNWNMINKNNIGKITIIKGPGPAKYGSGAMGGVIEMSTRKPLKPLEGNLEFSYGTFNTITANISLGGIKRDTVSPHKFYWGINGFGRKSNGYTIQDARFLTAADTVLEPSFLKEMNTSVKAGYQFNSTQNAEIQINYFDDIRGNGVKIFDDYGAYSKHTTNFAIARYSGNSIFFKWNANAYHILENYSRIYEYLNEGEYKLYGADSKRTDQGGELSLVFDQLNHHQFTSGFYYKKGSVDGKDTYYTSTDIISNAGKMITYAAYLQNEMSFFDKKLQVNLGIRYDAAHFYDGLFTIDYPSYSLIFYETLENISIQPQRWDALCIRFSSQYKFLNKNRVFFSAARGFRAPALDDMCRTGRKRGNVQVANPELKPELINTFELGCDISLHEKTWASVSLYYIQGNDFMYSTSTGKMVNLGYTLVPLMMKRNIGKVEIYGFESELKYELNDNFLFFTNYSYTHAKIIEDKILNSGQESDLTGKYLTDIPDHKVSAGITWENKWVNVSILSKYIGTTWVNDSNMIDTVLGYKKFPDYMIFNIRFEREIIKNFSAFLSIENAFNKIYIDAEERKNPGRLLTFSLKYKF